MPTSIHLLSRHRLTEPKAHSTSPNVASRLVSSRLGALAVWIWHKFQLCVKHDVNLHFSVPSAMAQRLKHEILVL